MLQDSKSPYHWIRLKELLLDDDADPIRVAARLAITCIDTDEISKKMGLSEEALEDMVSSLIAKDQIRVIIDEDVIRVDVP